jgi:hypothetical protein
LERRAAYAKNAPTTDELRELAQVQARVDSTFRELGLQGAPPPVAGELPRQYRARLGERLQKFVYTDSVRKANLYKLSTLAPDAFDIFESQIHEEAKRRAADGTWSGDPDGGMRERKTVDAAGRAWTEFAGPSTLSWMDNFMMPRRRVRSVIDSRGERRKLDGSLLR